MPSFERLNRRYGPWVSLALGVAAVVYMRRGLGFAPVAVGVLMLAWVGAAALRRLAPVIVPADSVGEPITSVPRWRRLVLPAAGSLVIGLWQNVLFYLLPLWWASAVPGSWNVSFPIVLAGMALLSCFEHRWRDWVLDRPLVHAAWSAVVLFATLVPVGAVLAVPLRISLAASAAAAALVAAVAVVPRMRVSRVGRGLTVVAVTAAAATFVPWAAPVLPPVPVVRMDSGTGTAVSARVLVGAADAFPAGTERIYAWFAVAVPARYRQAVRFEWYRDGEPAGRVVETFVVGGRREGFRTWSSRTAPAPGRWRVDLRTDSSQLVARESFVVR
ncbi:MAG: DUF2914 domain-containing protein [Burkholderiales bacterium]|nr:DUF2914 domain-containing protein [Burkholderiales bacterium]